MTNNRNQRRKEKLLRSRKVDDIPTLDEQIPTESEKNTPVDTSESTTVVEKLADKNTLREQQMAILEAANELYKFVKEYNKKHPEFAGMSDKQKIDLFRGKLGYSKLMDELPIVTRYMICMGQYSSKALKKVIDKSEKMVHPPPEKREKDYMQDQWIRRQADYVKYMADHYNAGKHCTQAELNYIWNQTYKLLKGEFDDFKDMHTEIEKKVKDEKKVLVGKNVRDLVTRLHSGKQSLTTEEEVILKSQLTNILIKKSFKNVMEEMLELYEPVEPVIESVGKGTATPSQKITMIETVDVERMEEIDDKYKPDGLKGMVPTDPDDIYELVEEYDSTPQ